MELTRQFKVTGTRYEVELQVENMHNPDDHVEMRWFVYCANPVIPADWDIVFNPCQHMTDHFTIGPSISFYPNSAVFKNFISVLSERYQKVTQTLNSKSTNLFDQYFSVSRNIS